MYSENLKKIRKILGLSVDKFALELGIPASTIWGYEGKKRVPSIDLSIRLYQVYNVNLNWFVSGEGNMFNTIEPSVNNDELEQKVVEVMKKYGVIEK